MKEWRAPPMPLAEAGCASSGGVPSLIGTGVVSDGARSVVFSLYGSDGRRHRWIFIAVVHAVRVADTVRVATRVPVRHSVIMGLCQQMGH